MLWFGGDSKYLQLEDIISRIDTPFLRASITFFNQLEPDVALLHHLIGRTETFEAPNRAEVVFTRTYVEITISQQESMTGYKMLKLKISCRASDWQLSSLAQVRSSALLRLPSLEHLGIWDDGYLRPEEHDDRQPQPA